MRKTILGAVALLAISGAAHAADYQRPVYKAPAAPAAAGDELDRLLSRRQRRLQLRPKRAAPPSPAPPSEVDISKRVDGWLGGVQAGYNWQVEHELAARRRGRLPGDRRARRRGRQRRIDARHRSRAATSISSRSWRREQLQHCRGSAPSAAGSASSPIRGPALRDRRPCGRRRSNTRHRTSSPRSCSGRARPGRSRQVRPSRSPARNSPRRRRASAGPPAPASNTNSAANWSGKLEYLYVDLGRSTYFSGIAGTQTEVRFPDHIARAGINYTF